MTHEHARLINLSTPHTPHIVVIAYGEVVYCGMGMQGFDVCPDDLIPARHTGSGIPIMFLPPLPPYLWVN